MRKKQFISFKSLHKIIISIRIVAWWDKLGRLCSPQFHMQIVTNSMLAAYVREHRLLVEQHSATQLTLKNKKDKYKSLIRILKLTILSRKLSSNSFMIWLRRCDRDRWDFSFDSHVKLLSQYRQSHLARTGNATLSKTSRVASVTSTTWVITVQSWM